MSLRESIKDLKNVAKRLDAAKFNPEMNELEKFLQGIKVDKPAKPPEEVLKKLLERFLRGDRDFSSREIRNLPFIFYEPEVTLSDVIELLCQMDFQRTNHLRGVLGVYLLNYDGSEKTEQLGRLLNNVRRVESPALRKIFAARENLFVENHMANMAKLLAQKMSVNAVLAELGLSNFYKTSNFVQTALTIFFRLDKNISAQLKILDELDAEFDTYKNIFPAVADALIQTVARVGFGKEKCIEIFYRRLGDPRFGYMRFNWDEVSPKSKAIFLRWLVEDDLEIFFKIIKQTAVDRMWRYREKFWRAYLPFISNTWIFLGSDARRTARELNDKNMGHGNLDGGSRDQSVFVFQIRQYIFLEWSHNGKLTVYKSEIANHFFGLSSLMGVNITSNVLKDWVHSSPKTYSWQRKVSEWLRENCGIDKTQRDWGLEN